MFHYEDGSSIVIDWRPEYATNMQRVIENFTVHSSLREDTVAEELEVNLNTCLELFTEEEQLTVSNSWFCSTCNTYVPSRKKLSLKCLPPILIIHLKRFQYTNIYRDKITSLVNFPLKDFDLSKFVLDQTKPPIYDLYAVSNHIGGMSGGHYTAFALHESDQNWYKLDDSHCSLLHDPCYIVTPNAYLLFYKLRESPTYIWPESIQFDDEEDAKLSTTSTTTTTTTTTTTPTPITINTTPISSPPEEPKHIKENTKYYQPMYDDPIVTDDEPPFHHPHFENLDYSSYPTHKDMSESLYVCVICSADLPSLEEFQVHILTAHYEEAGTELLLH